MRPTRISLLLLLAFPLAAVAQQKAEGPLKPLPQVESGVNVEKRKREEAANAAERKVEITKSPASNCTPLPVMTDEEIERCRKDRRS